jgi:hypothetical protein
MKKLGLIVALVMFGFSAFAGVVVKPYTFSNNTVASATEVNSDFDTLYTLANGNIDNANVKSAAGIVASKIAAGTFAAGAYSFAGSTITNASLTSPTITTSPTAAGATWANLGTVSAATSITTSALVATTADINAGTFDGIVGGTTPAAGTFTTLNATGGGALTGTWTNLGTITTADINGGTWQGTIDGAWTAAGQTCANLGTVSAATSITGTTITATTLKIGSDDVSKMLVPIGTIIPFYDFDDALTFDTAYWAYCDGSSATIAGIGAQTLPDLSNRYLVGFGTEGGGDIDTAAWATAAVGNASHQVSLSHTHAAGTYAGPNHTHTMGDHTHGAGTLQFKTGYATSNIYIYMYNSDGSSEIAVANMNNQYTTGSGNLAAKALINAPGSPIFYTKDGAGATGTPSTNTSDAAGTGAITGSSASAGSATTDVQPRSIRVRYVMRVR